MPSSPGAPLVGRLLAYDPEPADIAVWADALYCDRSKQFVKQQRNIRLRNFLFIAYPFPLETRWANCIAMKAFHPYASISQISLLM